MYRVVYNNVLYTIETASVNYKYMYIHYMYMYNIVKVYIQLYASVSTTICRTSAHTHVSSEPVPDLGVDSELNGGRTGCKSPPPPGSPWRPSDATAA